MPEFGSAGAKNHYSLNKTAFYYQFWFTPKKSYEACDTLLSHRLPTRAG